MQARQRLPSRVCASPRPTPARSPTARTPSPSVRPTQPATPIRPRPATRWTVDTNTARHDDHAASRATRRTRRRPPSRSARPRQARASSASSTPGRSHPAPRARRPAPLADGHAHLHGRCDRPGRQHGSRRPATYSWTIDLSAPDTSLTATPAALSQQRQPAASPSRAARPARASNASSTAAPSAVCASPSNTGPAQRRYAHLHRRGDRPGRQRRPDPGQLQLDGRHNTARHDDHRQAKRPVEQGDADLLVQLERSGLELPVQARRRRRSHPAPRARRSARSPTVRTPSRSSRPTRPATRIRPLRPTAGRSTRRRRR